MMVASRRKRTVPAKLKKPDEKKEKNVQMDFQKQSKYRERRTTVKNKGVVRQRVRKSLTDRARNVGKKIKNLEIKTKEVKEVQRNASKKNKMILNMKMQKLKAELNMLKVELATHGKTLSSKNV